MSKIDLRIRNNNKLYSIVLNDYRIGGCKWNDIEHGKCIEFPVNKEDVFVALGVDKTIANLQSQLDQANERLKGLPKFGIGQKVYYVRDTTFPIEIDEIQSRQGNFFYVDYTYNEIFKESELVATREEAQAKLKEIQESE